jgi:hypothetical protein
MRLAGPADAFELRLVRYQFPAADGWWDANWLVIEISAQSEGRSWQAEDAALLTVDVAELADWLSRVATGRDVPQEIGFMEPCLAFILDGPVGQARDLFIDVAHELSPPWFEGEDRFGAVARLRFAIDPIALLDASASLRQQLEAFPLRGHRPRDVF